MLFIDETRDPSRFVHKKTCVETALEARTGFLKWYRLSKVDIQNALRILPKSKLSDYQDTHTILFSRDMYGLHVLWQTSEKVYYDFWNYRTFKPDDKSLGSDRLIELFFKENLFNDFIHSNIPHEHYDIWIAASKSDNVTEENTAELRIIND